MFNLWTLKKRLALTFAAILALTSMLMGIALLNNSKLRSTMKWNTHTYEVLAESNRMLLNMVNIETGMRGFVAGGDEKFLEPFTGGKQAFAIAFEKAKSLTSDNPAQQSRLDKMLADHKQFMQVADHLITLRRDVTGAKAPLDGLLHEFSAGNDKVAMDAFRAQVAEFAKAEEDLLVIRSAALSATMSETQSALLYGGLGLFVLTGALGLLLTRSVFRQLGAEPSVAAAAVNAVAQGDLTVAISVRPGDTDSLLASLARMRDSLVTVVTAVRENSESVASASTQIEQGNQDLASRTEQQASALQETAATMEQLGTTVRNNSDGAKNASQLARGASVVAARGGEVVGQVVTTMQHINDSSRQIGEIITVIDGIAFQTNILALNAAVEAARAGVHGRGFAVVASEVRSLAQRSAEAAKEIKQLIGRSVEQVEQGTALVDQAGRTMGEIVASIRSVTDIVAEISAASIEQSAGVLQVGQAVGQMDQTTQHNAALVEECAAAAESLKSQAEHLVKAVAVFKLAKDEGAWSGSASGPRAALIQRRGPDRAKHISRPQSKAKRPAAVGHATQSAETSGTDDWGAY